MKSSLVLAPLAVAGLLWSQEPNPTQNLPPRNDAQTENQQNQQNPNSPIFRVQVVSRTITAVSYRNRSGWTRVDFQGTALAPKAEGRADVNSWKGYI